MIRGFGGGGGGGLLCVAPMMLKRVWCSPINFTKKCNPRLYYLCELSYVRFMLICQAGYRMPAWFFQRKSISWVVPGLAD